MGRIIGLVFPKGKTEPPKDKTFDKKVNPKEKE